MYFNFHYHFFSYFIPNLGGRKIVGLAAWVKNYIRPFFFLSLFTPTRPWKITFLYFLSSHLLIFHPLHFHPNHSVRDKILFQTIKRYNHPPFGLNMALMEGKNEEGKTSTDLVQLQSDHVIKM